MILLRPCDAWALYVFAQGAGAGMRHAFMESLSQASIPIDRAGGNPDRRLLAEDEILH